MHIQWQAFPPSQQPPSPPAGAEWQAGRACTRRCEDHGHPAGPGGQGAGRPGLEAEGKGEGAAGGQRREGLAAGGRRRAAGSEQLLSPVLARLAPSPHHLLREPAKPGEDNTRTRTLALSLTYMCMGITTHYNNINKNSNGNTSGQQQTKFG